MQIKNKKIADLGLLEEDDAFEEFSKAEGTEDADDVDVDVWDANWEDDAVAEQQWEDFRQKLRQVVEKLRQQNEMLEKEKLPQQDKS